MENKPAPESKPGSHDDEGSTSPPPAVHEPPHGLRDWLVWPGLLAVLTLGMFGGVLFTSKPVVLSKAGLDLSQQFLPWRSFGFGELSRGNLPLWNPHLYCGAPFFGGFQSALLYPLNALFLVLPVPRAVNWSIALHVFLAGAFTYAWAARRGLRPAACFLAAVMFMFCGAHFLHIYAGHLPNLCALVWAPLLFLAIDGLCDAPAPGWSLLGMFALAMQVLAGHPQYVFYTGVAAGLYSALCLGRTERRIRFVLGLAGIAAGGAALSAVQLFTAFQESRETVRQAMPYEFASTFSFPPENFLTLLAPDIFGDLQTVPYWGRCFLWEMSVFIGVSGLVLAVLGAVGGRRSLRRYSTLMVVVLFLLALGAHTPLLKLLYGHVPGFNEFRGNSKFMFLASLFLAMLAGLGFNELLGNLSAPRRLVVGTAGSGLLLLAAGLAVHQLDAHPAVDRRWHSLMLAMRNTGETSLAPEQYEDAALAQRAKSLAARSLSVAGTTALVVALLVWCAGRYRPAVWLLLGLAVFELFAFARKSLATFDPQPSDDAGLKQFLNRNPGDYRIMNPVNPNAALSAGACDIWGSDPGVLLRYAQFFLFAQGVDPDQVATKVIWPRDHPFLDMLRLRFVFRPQDDQVMVYERTNFLPHLILARRYRVVNGRDAILSAMTNASFNPRAEVILESTPDPEPEVANETGTARIIHSSTDSLTLDANVKSPGILLITDTYARGWRARALPGSSQQHYQIMPGDYCLRAIPLAAGEHHLRVEYLPPGFVAGKWVSLIALLVFAGLAANRGWRAGTQRLKSRTT